MANCRSLDLRPPLKETLPDFFALIKKLYSTKWIVYAKAPFGRMMVLRYLGRYTHRIAISNRRIISVSEKKVAFIQGSKRQR